MSVKLFVLGLVYERDTYGYEIKATSHLWGLERWAQIKDGSIYHALGKLDEEGLIQERNVEPSGSNRPRYVYCITPAGSQAFLALLRETCRSAPTEGRGIDLGLAFIRHLHPEERVFLLKERHRSLSRARDELAANSADLHKNHSLAPWVSASVDHSLVRLDSEIEWNLRMIDSVAQWGLVS